MSRVLERVGEQTERSTGKVAARSRMDGWMVGANRDHLLKMRGKGREAQHIFRFGQNDFGLQREQEAGCTQPRREKYAPR